jgi:hypothetical protein
MVEIFENKICERLHHSASIKKAGGALISGMA